MHLNSVVPFLRIEKIEHILLYKNDRLLKHFTGNETTVVVENKYLTLFNDSEAYHNHIQGSSFSESDVVEAIKNNVKIFHLITSNFQYTLKRPSSGWGIKFENEEVIQTFNNCKTIANDIIDNALSKNEIRYDEIELVLNHYIWVLFFNNYGISYKKKPI